jgi:uncharacterized iron-regulated membrane protein
MNSWQRWVQAPQTHWGRQLVLQMHLWMGIGFGLYILIISLSGSAILLKSPFYEWFTPRKVEPTNAIPLEGDALAARMAEVYAGYTLGFTTPPEQQDDAVYIVLNKDGEYFPHYFNQYTGEDAGSANPWPIQAIYWLADVHDDLLLGDTGTMLNGIGGLIFVLMCLSGVLIWWQGRTRWLEGLQIKRQSKRSFIWQLHSFIGFWSLLLMFSWGVSGIQLGFPEYVYGAIEWINTNLTDALPLDSVLRFFRRVHFTRYGQGPWATWGWIIASFVPAILLVSGVTHWWMRVVQKQKTLSQTAENPGP